MRQSTSVQSFQEIKFSGTERSQLLRCLNYLRRNVGGATDREAMHDLHIIDPNSYRPRRNELVQLGLVENRGKRACEISGKTVIVWGVKQ
jgi:hypothetical protein